MNLHELPTPRTDAQIRKDGTDGDGDAYLHANFCRQFEQEAAAWKAVAEKCLNAYMHEDVAEARQAFDALKTQLP